MLCIVYLRVCSGTLYWRLSTARDAKGSQQVISQLPSDLFLCLCQRLNIRQKNITRYRQRTCLVVKKPGKSWLRHPLLLLCASQARQSSAALKPSADLLYISVLDTPDCKPNRCRLRFCLRQQRNGCRACTVRPEVVNSGSCAFFIAKALLRKRSPQLAMQWYGQSLKAPATYLPLAMTI